MKKDITIAIFEKNSKFDELFKEEIHSLNMTMAVPTDNMSNYGEFTGITIKNEDFDIEIEKIKVKRKDIK